MDLAAVRALCLETHFDVYGVDAVVTRPAPDDTPIATRLIWMTPQPDDLPRGGVFQRQEPRVVVALPRASVPTVPIDTTILAPTLEEVHLAAVEDREPLSLGWIVKATDRVEGGHVRVAVVRYPTLDEVAS